MLWLYGRCRIKLSGIRYIIMELFEKIEESFEFLKKEGIEKPDVAIILGTGLGQSFIKKLNIKKSIPYKNIPHFPEATVEYHEGEIHWGTFEGKKLLIFQGRFHYYEGYTMSQVTLPVRIISRLGASYLLLSNAAGCINLAWNKGDLMIIDDHINLQPENPLTGINDARLGPKFVDLSEPYSSHLNHLIEDIAREKGYKLRKGVYVAVSGPNLETRAEYRFLKIIGADAVGMSTVPEVLVANQVGLPCAAISVLTDECDPDNLKPVDIPDILETASIAEKKLSDLYLELIKRSE